MFDLRNDGKARCIKDTVTGFLETFPGVIHQAALQEFLNPTASETEVEGSNEATRNDDNSPNYQTPRNDDNYPAARTNRKRGRRDSDYSPSDSGSLSSSEEASSEYNDVQDEHERQAVEMTNMAEDARLQAAQKRTRSRLRQPTAVSTGKLLSSAEHRGWERKWGVDEELLKLIKMFTDTKQYDKFKDQLQAAADPDAARNILKGLRYDLEKGYDETKSYLEFCKQFPEASQGLKCKVSGDWETQFNQALQGVQLACFNPGQ